MEDLAFALEPPHLQPEQPYEIRRFSLDGTVVVRGAIASVFIGGLLIGTASDAFGVPRALLLCAVLCLLGIGGALLYQRRGRTQRLEIRD